ncbi:MAG: DUF58 domain-containing protein [Pseudomonadota bacterium]
MSGRTAARHRLVDLIQLTWLRRHPPASRQDLGYRRLFILPTRTGLFFLFCAGLIFLLSVNYVLSLGLSLAFFMFSLFMAAILVTFRNLYGLRLSSVEDQRSITFAGQPLVFRVLLDAGGADVKAVSIRFWRSRSGPAPVTPDRGPMTVELSLPASDRGLHKAPPVRVQSLYPTGLCRVWADVDLDMRCLVAPKPSKPALMHVRAASGQQSRSQHRPRSGEDAGNEHFHGLRDYRHGDNLSRVAWKSLAGQRQLQVKMFGDETDGGTMLRWSDHEGADAESRLSWLCYRVLEADRNGSLYGLQLPGQHFAPGRGSQHRRRLLEALALHGMVDS